MNDFLQNLRSGQPEKQRPQKTRKNYDNSYHHNSSSRFNSYGGYQNNRNQHMKRPPASHQPGNQISMDEQSATPMLADAIESLSSYIETLAKNQNSLVTAQERTADMLERQAIAIERVLDHLNIAPAQKPEPKSTKSVREIAPVEPVKDTQPVKDTAPVKPFKKTKPVTNTKPVKPVVRKRKKTVAKKPDMAKKPDKTASTDNKLLSREAVMDIINTMRSEDATFNEIASRLIELGQPSFSGRGEWHAQTIHRICNKRK